MMTLNTISRTSGDVLKISKKKKQSGITKTKMISKYIIIKITKRVIIFQQL